MYVLGLTLEGIAQVLSSILWLFLILIIARVVISWVNADPYNLLVRVIIQSTDPLLSLFGRWRLSFGGLDFTPIVILLLIQFLQYVLVGALLYYGAVLKGM